jgi:RHS repeat-associated protein
LQDELNLGWLDYHARQYDPALGKFLSVDPASEVLRRVSTYAYAINNPLRFVDPDGMVAQDTVKGPRGDLLEGFNNGYKKFDETMQSLVDDPAGVIGGLLTKLWEDPGGLIDEVATDLTMKAEAALSGDDTAAGELTFDVAVAVLTEGVTRTTAPAEASNTVTKVASKTVEISELKPTHYILDSKTNMIKLTEDIKANGIKKPLNYVEQNGQKHIVTGNQRYFAAQKLGIKEVPAQEVTLPYAGYKSTSDLIIEGKQPGWWRWYQP